VIRREGPLERKQGSVRSLEDLVSFVDKFGTCYLFRKDRHTRLYDLVREGDAFRRRGLLLGWSEEAHLKKKLFLSVDERGSLLLLPWGKAKELSEAGSYEPLTEDEISLLALLIRPMSTPEMRKALGIPMGRFEVALVRARSRVRIALVGVRRESKTKYVNIYDRAENWL
jgi:hypothetical protein